MSSNASITKQTKLCPQSTPNILQILDVRTKRRVLSVILSFLNENDGTCTLLTNRFWARRVLPIFCLPEDHELCMKGDISGDIKDGTSDNFCKENNQISISKLRIRRARHKFLVVHVEDSSVLLDRLNSTKLLQRIRMLRDEVISCDEKSDERQKKGWKAAKCYPLGMETDEIAWYEWNEARLRIGIPQKRRPSSLELLRYRTKSLNPFCSPMHVLQKIQSLNFHQLSILKKSSQLEILPPKLCSGTTLLASYPRSGNTLLRNIIERVTTFVTGSDTRPDRSLSRSLAEHLVGEGIVTSNLCPIIKTHFPERRGCLPFPANRIILLVRNPFDALDSYWNMCCTNSHNQSLDELVYDLYEEKFQGMAQSEIVVWVKFHQYWIQRSSFCNKQSGLPMLVIRYEDLLLNTVSVIEQVVDFLLEKNDGQTGDNLHHFWKCRIRSVLGLKKIEEENKVEEPNKRVDTASLGSYKPRCLVQNKMSCSSQIQSKTQDNEEKHNTSISIGKSLKKERYSEYTLEHMHNKSYREMNMKNLELNFLSNFSNEEKVLESVKKNHKKSWLKLFGYDIYSQNFPQNFEKDEQPSLSWDELKYFRGKNDEPDTEITSKTNGLKMLKVNVGTEIRQTSDPYGRAMFEWRKRETNNGKIPFPTKSR